MPDPDSSFALPALVVSISSAAVTLTGLAWNLWLYRLQGARLKVQLVFSWAENGPRTWSVSETRRPILFGDISFEHPDRFGIEYGRVRVTNVGRTAVSVENISFDFAQPRRRLRRHRHTVQPSQFRHKDAADDQPMTDLSIPARLEPGDNITADFYLWPALASRKFGTGSGRAVRVRGSAHAVGRRRSTRSSRRRAWKLPADTWTMFRDVEVTPELRVFRELWWNHTTERVSSSIALLMYREINERLSNGGDTAAIENYIDSHTKQLDEPVFNGLLAYNLHHAYHHDAPPLWPDPKPRRRMLLDRLRCR